MALTPDSRRIQILADKYLKGLISSEEQQEFDNWFAEHSDHEQYRIELDLLRDEHEQHLLYRIHHAAGIKRSQPQRRWSRFAIAASIVLALCLFSYLFIKQEKPQAPIAQIIVPGSNKAQLRLADGSLIALDGKKQSVSIGLRSIKYADGTDVTENVTAGYIQQMAIITPTGGQYQTTLPDGTHVWLNAASSLRFPSQFSEQRLVELTGEAYFEVAKDKAHPFIVKTARQEVKVLGTHFNINSYEDEYLTKTTLLEGAVQLNNSIVLKPGQQAATDHSLQTSLSLIEADKAIAWKNGKFVFDDENIASIMRKLSRWYNIEVAYQGDFSERTFTGSVSRQDDIRKILDKISYIEALHFKIEGRRITVMK